MELRHLRYFVAALREGSVTRAAKILNMAQPPLSRQIQQLEDELGVSLLERGRRPLHMTEAGRFFFEHALTILDRAEALKTMTRRIGQIGKRRFGIGVVGSILYGPLPEMIRRFRVTHPKVDIEIVELPSTHQVEALKEGRIDLGFCRLNFEDEDAVIRREILMHEPLVAALPIGHPLLDQGGPLLLKDLARGRLIVYRANPGPSFADQVLAQLRERTLDVSRVHEVSGLQMALGLVAAAEGICLVPAAVQRLRRDDVVYRPLREGQITSPIIMCSRMDDDTREIAVLLQLVRDAYRAHDRGGEASGHWSIVDDELAEDEGQKHGAIVARL